ncbi:MAG: hypothetical protein U1A77_21485 [Pirellulales bacterium]
MSDNVNRFCVNVHEKLESLQSRMDGLKLNIGSSWHLLQERLGEMRLRGKSRQIAVAEARGRLEQWFRENESESRGTVEHETGHREALRAARASKAEESAWIAIMLAEASIDDVERMVLEVIAAQGEAETVTNE